MKYDVFVSYAHVNNDSLVPGKPGWVTTLVEHLRSFLAQKLPRRPGEPAGAAVWMDPRLPGNEAYDAKIEEALEESATLLVILSNAYLHSPWCTREREAFLRRAARDPEHARGRVFVVEFEEVPRPPELEKLPGYRFWTRGSYDRTSRPLGFPVPTPDERTYYDLLWDVAAEMSGQLRAVRQEGPPAPPPSGPVAYLAETTDDLDAQRDEVRRYLAQAGFRVVPEGWYPHDDPERYAAAATGDMAHARLFVQLLGPVPGRRPPAVPEGFAALQCRLAEAAKLPVVQWRPRELDPSTVTEPHLRALLERPTVQATGLEEFKRNVAELLRKPSPAPPAPSAPGELKFVFVDSDRPDQELAASIRKALRERQLGASVMLREGSPEQMREYLQANLVSCDGLIMVYGGASQAWLISQVQEYRKARARRDRDVQAWAVYDGPPAEKDELAFGFPNLAVLDCRRGFDAAALDAFVARLAAEAAE
ncbi:MAG TPA: toll/interleukin-1 receptor domain-containing protein [Longimicrobium sp.]|nr:toll/interleukin-1 receptor domain-containing protein [Longimicrobium sp.]